jgi:hypothetical protein
LPIGQSLNASRECIPRRIVVLDRAFEEAIPRVAVPTIRKDKILRLQPLAKRTAETVELRK